MRLDARLMRQIEMAPGLCSRRPVRDVHPIRSYANGRQQSQEIDV